MRFWRGVRPMMQTVALMFLGGVIGSLITLSITPTTTILEKQPSTVISVLGSQ